MSFQSYSLKLALCDVLKAQGIIEATPIQALAFDPIVTSSDVYLQAQTGSGKTLAYLLPLLSKLETNTTDLQILILAPTHELAIQIQEVVKSFQTCYDPNLKSQLLLGDTSSKRQIEKLKKKPHLVVGTVGRINDLIDSKKLKTHKVKTVIIDEADRLLLDASLETLTKIIQSTPKERQLIFVSATNSAENKHKIEHLSHSMQWLRPDDSQINPNITHAYLETTKDQKLDSLRLLLKACKPTKAMIFAHHQETIAFIVASLQSLYKTIGLLGGMDKLERQNAIESFRSGKMKIFVCTDLAARGLDIPDVSHVVNFDLPTQAENYLHRAGRTGRIGKEGGCISLIEKKELHALEKIEKELGIQIEAL